MLKIIILAISLFNFAHAVIECPAGMVAGTTSSSIGENCHCAYNNSPLFDLSSTKREQGACRKGKRQSENIITSYFWLDASNINYNPDNQPISNSNVTLWRDISGKDVDLPAVQVFFDGPPGGTYLHTAEPTAASDYRARAYRDVIRCHDNITFRLIGEPIPSSLSYLAHTIFIVFKMRSVGTNLVHLLRAYRLIGVETYFNYFVGIDPAERLNYQVDKPDGTIASAGASDIILAPGNTYIYMLRYDTSGNLRIYHNNQLRVNNSFPGTPPYSNSNRFILCELTDRIDILEVIIHPKALNDIERNNMFRYLNEKYGVTD